MPARWTSLLTLVLTFATAVLGVTAVYVLLIAPGPTESENVPTGPADRSMATVDTSLQQAPDFALPTMEGDSFRLSAHRGEVVVLNFWATWCAPCRQEIPMFMELQRELSDAGLQFVGIALDQEGFEVVRPFARAMNINYPIAVDDGTVAPLYGGIPEVPTTFLIGPEGHVHGYAPGLVTESVLRPQVERLLARIDE